MYIYIYTYIERYIHIHTPMCICNIITYICINCNHGRLSEFSTTCFRFVLSANLPSFYKPHQQGPKALEFGTTTTVTNILASSAEFG